MHSEAGTMLQFQVSHQGKEQEEGTGEGDRDKREESHLFIGFFSVIVNLLIHKKKRGEKKMG